MADISYDDLDLIQAGQTTADMFKKVVNQARNEACDFFRGSPGTIIPIPGSAALYFAWQSLCKNSSSGLPQPAQPPFQGGQCNVDYNVHAKWNLRNKNGSLAQAIDSTQRVPGRIISMGLENPTAEGGVGLKIYYFDWRRQVNDFVESTNGGFPNFYTDGLAIISINRVDGLADNCGSLPQAYPISNPPPTPTIIGGDTYNLPTINVTLNDGSLSSYSASLTLNGGDGFPSIHVGDIGISIGGGGITITNQGGTGPGGGTFNPNIQGQLNAIGISLGGISSVTNTSNNTINNVNNTTNQIKDDTGGIKKNTDPPPKPGGPGTKPPSKQPDNQRKKDNIQKLISVQVIVTTPPPTSLQQFGSEGSSDVWYTGWFTWRQAGHDMMKLQISYLDSIFIAPKGVDGYGFTLTHGALGYAIENTGSEDS